MPDNSVQHQVISTYLCPILIPTFLFEELENISEIEFEDIDKVKLGLVDHAKILVKLWPAIEQVGCSLSRAKFSTKLCKEESLLELPPCPYCLLESTLSWKRPVKIIDNFPGIIPPRADYDDWIITTWNDPDHCHWIKSSIYLMHGPVDSDELYAYTAPFPVGLKEIPLDENGNTSKEDTGRGGIEQNIGSGIGDISDFAVPGQRIVLQWAFDNSESYIAYIVEQTWFHTPLTVGGKIIEVIGDYGTLEIKYVVEIFGQKFICLPTDFAKYHVDDWVFIVKKAAQTCDRIEEYTDQSDGPMEEMPDSEPGEDYPQYGGLIIPFTVNNVGPSS